MHPLVLLPLLFLGVVAALFVALALAAALPPLVLAALLLLVLVRLAAVLPRRQPRRHEAPHRTIIVLGSGMSEMTRPRLHARHPPASFFLLHSFFFFIFLFLFFFVFVFVLARGPHDGDASAVVRNVRRVLSETVPRGGHGQAE
jgi:hypothetical protein